jgi:hypothetical protein
MSPERNGSQPSSFEFRLYVLRRWNSFTPILPEAASGPGGGYFLYWRAGTDRWRGIVIDPGFDFLRNYEKEGLPLHAIDAVFLTHSHVDHIRDFEPILTGRYEKNDIIEKWGWPKKDDDRPGLDLFVSADAFRKLVPMIDAQSHTTIRKDKIRVLGSGSTLNLRAEYDLEVEVLEARHGSDDNPWLQHAVGLIFRLFSEDHKVLTIGFTSDSRPSKEFAAHFEGCDVVVAHLGTVTLPQLVSLARLGLPKKLTRSLREWEATGELIYKSREEPLIRMITGIKRRDDKDANTFGQALPRQLVTALWGSESLVSTQDLSGHLQLLGVFQVLKRAFDSGAQLGIVSEFGLELGPLRHKVADSINEALFGSVNGRPGQRAIAGDIGLVVRVGPSDLQCDRAPSSLEGCSGCRHPNSSASISIRCTDCGRFIPTGCIEDLCIRHKQQAIIYSCPECLKPEFWPSKPLVAWIPPERRKGLDT